MHLFERDCSLQRRHQKVIEEAPAPGMDAATRELRLRDRGARRRRAVDYVGAGTVEFIADASEGLSADRIWFMEMNTRLQVEHPVTEAITGQDLVEWQLRVASGEPLPRTQDEITIDGWAMEARLYAENSDRGLSALHRPTCGIFGCPRDSVSTAASRRAARSRRYYDPMIAKLIVHAPNRRGGRAQTGAPRAQASKSGRCKPTPRFSHACRRCRVRRGRHRHGLHRASCGDFDTGARTR